MRKGIEGKAFLIAKATLFTLLLLVSATLTNAQTTTTFAQYTQKTNGQDYTFTNNLSNATFRTTNLNVGSAVNFTYLGVVGLPAQLSGPQDAHVFVSGCTNVFASVVNGRLVQSFNNQLCNTPFTIRVVRDTPYLGRTNLLTATVSPVGTSYPELSGDQTAGSGSAAFTAATGPQVVTFTSDFVSFSGTTIRNLALALSSINPNYSLGFNFLNSFTAAGTATFAANQTPIFLIPTAATVTLRGQVLTSKGRPLTNARVTLTNATGETVTVLTDQFGKYEFNDVVVGETVIIDVISKLYSYPTQILNLSEETNGLDFVPQYAKERFR
jgi:hypothetical protein